MQQFIWFKYIQCDLQRIKKFNFFVALQIPAALIEIRLSVFDQYSTCSRYVRPIKDSISWKFLFRKSSICYNQIRICFQQRHFSLSLSKEKKFPLDYIRVRILKCFFLFLLFLSQTQKK